MIWEFEDRLSSVCIDILCSFGTFSFHAVVNIYLRVTVKLYYRWWSILKSINADDTQTKVHQLHVSRIQMKFENEIDDYASDGVVRQQRESQTMKIIKRFQRCDGFICNHLWKCRVSNILKMMLVRQTVNILLPINYRNKTRHKYNYPLWILIYSNSRLKYWVLACLANL